MPQIRPRLIAGQMCLFTPVDKDRDRNTLIGSAIVGGPASDYLPRYAIDMTLEHFPRQFSVFTIPHSSSVFNAMVAYRTLAARRHSQGQ
jgi:hypothetical protein